MMIIESGLIIFFGMLLLGAKLEPRTSLRLLGHPVKLDLAISILALALHWGTFSGVMAAATAGLLCSIFTSIARRIFGYIEHNKYIPGFITVKLK